METNTKRGIRAHWHWPLGACVVAALVLSVPACAPRREAVVSTRTVTVEQHAVAAPKMVDISIVGLHDEPAPDPRQERVVGTIVNQGDRKVSGLSIRVDGIDDSGRVVTSVVTPPVRQEIDPYGGRATFEAFMPKSDLVAGYHAVAIAR